MIKITLMLISRVCRFQGVKRGIVENSSLRLQNDLLETVLEFLIAMRHLRLNSVLSGDKEEIPVADRTISRDRLDAHYGNSKVAKHFAVWSLISSSLETDADKRLFSSIKSPVAGWDTVASFHRAET